MTSERPVFVLVPGAWHQPSTWNLLRGELDRLGYASHAVKLATSGPGAHGTVHDDAEAIHRAIEGLGGPVIAVGHSYSGLPLTEGAADLPNVRHLIYLTAYLPDAGESMYLLHDMGDPEPETVEGLFPQPEDARSQLYGDVPEAVADQAVHDLVDQLHRPFADHVTKAAWRTVSSTYIVTENDNSIPVPILEKMSTRATNVRRIPTSHSPHLSCPGELAELFDEIARS